MASSINTENASVPFCYAMHTPILLGISPTHIDILSIVAEGQFSSATVLPPILPHSITHTTAFLHTLQTPDYLPIKPTFLYISTNVKVMQ